MARRRKPYFVGGTLLGYIGGQGSTFMSYDAKKRLIYAAPSLNNAKWALQREAYRNLRANKVTAKGVK